MAAPSGTFQAYQAVGNREDLTDAIYNISPTETPFVTMAAKVKAKAVNHEWQTDELLAAAKNSNIEGDDSAVNTAVPTVRLSNRLQIFKKTIQVAGTQEAVDKAGRASEIAYQLMKRGKELKRKEYCALAA
jgi:Xaa-Pro aminopeptidase